MIIGIGGKAGAGKDTLAKYIAMNHPNYCIRHLAAPIKAMLNEAFNWEPHLWNNREWKEENKSFYGFSPRKAAQTLGTEWRDIIDPTKLLWCKLLDNWRAKHRKVDVIVPDVRFKHEQQWIRDEGGIIIYITRCDNPFSVAPHKSETEIDKFLIDYFIENNKTEYDMYKQFIQMVGDQL